MRDVQTYQQENVVMFSRIMAKLEGNDLQPVDCGDFRIADLPLKQSSKLTELSNLCTEKPAVTTILVRQIFRHFRF